MFFSSEKKQLKELNKILQEMNEWQTTELPVLFLFQSLKVLTNKNWLCKEQLKMYSFINLKEIIGFTANLNYNLEGFIVNPEKETEFLMKIYEFSDNLVELSTINDELPENKKRIAHLVNFITLNLRKFASPDPKLGYNISEFRKS